MSLKYCLPVPVFHFWPKLTHPTARSLCDSWATWLFFCQTTAKTPAPIFTVNTSNDVFSRKDVLFGVSQTNFFRPHFPPQNGSFRPIFDGTFWKFRLKKALTIKMLNCKLPLIFIVAPWKLYNEEANRGSGGTQIWGPEGATLPNFGILGPPPYHGIGCS